MDEMYKCAMCKKEFDGEPALENGCGMFCAECKAIIHKRAERSLRKRGLSLNGRCLWCGEMITDATRETGKEDEHVCKFCSTNRDWLLKTIRMSSHQARYVARTEKREAPMREERERAERAAAKEKHESARGQKDDDASRIDRIERLLLELLARND